VTQPGASIYLDDGLLQLRVLSTSAGEVEAEVVRGGMLSSHKGVNLPGVKLDIPSLTEKDAADLRFALTHGVDLVALSFVRRPADAALPRAIMEEAGRETPLIAKIERQEALEQLPAVLRAFDGVMVARGDLGVELAPEKVPAAQKRIIERARSLGKPVITATQMLESMTQNPRPTRAEASDVANAVLDGTDAVMLSGETAVGMYPVETVRTMDRIVREAEAIPGARHGVVPEGHSDSQAVCSAAVRLAEELEVAAITALTRSGRTARMLSALAPPMPILAFLWEDNAMGRYLNLWRGVAPFVVDEAAGHEESARVIERELRSRKLVPEGSQVVVVGSAPGGPDGRTNFIRLLRV
jgi:pyruvate kinase